MFLQFVHFIYKISCNQKAINLTFDSHVIKETCIICTCNLQISTITSTIMAGDPTF